MRIIGVVTAGVLAVTVSACSSDDARRDEPVAKVSSTATSEPSTRNTHELAVTVRDEAGDIWKVDGGACLDGSDYGPPYVTVSDESGTQPLGDEVRLPESGTTPIDGACEAEVRFEAEPADRYALGVGLEGQGIATNDGNPDLTVVDGVDREPQGVTLVLK